VNFLSNEAGEEVEKSLKKPSGIAVAEKAPSLKVQAYCREAKKKVTHVLLIEEGLLLECEKCRKSIIVASPNNLICGYCYRKLSESVSSESYKVCSKCGSRDIEWYKGFFYEGPRCRRCDSHEYEWKQRVLYHYLSCEECREITRSDDKILPFYIGKEAKLQCSNCGEKKFKIKGAIKVLSAVCTYCRARAYCVGEEVLDVFSALCKSCNCETDWVETDASLMCLSCGTILRR
jgi:hypothetical protein